MALKDIEIAVERTLDRLLGVYKDRPGGTDNLTLAHLGKKFAVEIVTDHAEFSTPVAYSRPSQAQVRICAGLLSRELEVYPVEIIRKSKLERIVICSNLKAYHREVAGLAEMGLFVIDTIYINADSVSRDYEYARRTFHHELFHAIDYHDDLLKYVDPGWHQLNSAGYKASDDHHVLYNAPSDAVGFLSTHSMTAVYEDKAEIYAHLMVNYAELEARAREDEVLARKVERMKELLHRFSEEFNESFWNRVAQRSLSLKRYRYAPEAESLAAASQGSAAPGANRLARSGEAREETENGRRVWKLALDDGTTHTFFTFNKLCVQLQRLGLRRIPRKEDLKRGPWRFSADG
ncbi:MAG TPA: putative zinc-binding metallopeptidase [Candidatus Obscuribacterales bacterium]